MAFTSNLLASSVLEVEWSRTLMIGWILVTLILSVIEVQFIRKRPTMTMIKRGD